MAVLALAVAGSAVGTAIGGTFLGVTASTWGWAIGSLVGNALFGPKLPDQNVQGPRFSDLKIQSSAYGQMVPIVAGTYPVAGNVIWSTEVREVATTSTQTQDSKGGGSQTTTSTTYTYFVDCAILLCEGVAVGVQKIKFNGELKYDVSDTASSESVMASALNATAIRFYPGSETQTADPLIESYEGADTPAYRGCAYLVLEGLDVTPYGGKLPQIEAVVTMAGSEADLAVTTVATLGTTDGSTFVILGKQGNIFAGAQTSNSSANKWNFYSGSKLGSYIPPSFVYYPVGLTIDGECIASGSGSGVLAVLHEDGTTTRYTGGFANMGQGLLSTLYAPGIVAESPSVWWCRGDSGGSNTFFRAAVGTSSLATTQLSSVYCYQLARNACGVSGRCYMQASATSGGTRYLAYVSTDSSSLVLLVAVTTTGGICVSQEGDVWMGPADSAAERKTLRKYDRDGTLLLTVDIDNTEGLTSGWSPWEDRTGMIWAVGIVSGSNKRAYQIHPTTGDIIARSATFIGSFIGFTEDNRAVIWDSSTGSYVLKEIEALPRITAGTTSLSTYLTSLCARVGISASELDVTELAIDVVRGYAIARRDSLRSALSPLQVAYVFDVLESGGRIVFRKRGGSVVAEIEEDDLAARRYGEEPPAKIAASRKLETELPKEVAVQYLDADASFEVGSQYARRLTGESSDPASLDLPIVLTAEEAAQLAELVLYERWGGRTQIELALSRKWSHLEPADVITATADGITYTLRIEEKNEAAGLIKLSCVTEDVTVYSPVASGVDLPSNGLSVQASGPTALRILDIPLLRDVDDSAGFYAAAAGYYDGWPGADLWVSRDEGVTWEKTQTTFLESSVIGTALTALSTFSGGNVFDELNTVTVQVFGGDLSSASEALVQSGTNTCYLGGEILSFKTATLVSTGRYTLSGLRRGRKGTEQYMTTHAIGEPFVLLSTSATRRVRLETSDIGIALLYKAVTFGQYLAEASEVSFTPGAIGLEPLSPVNIRAGRTAAASWDISIAWNRRARKNAEWRSYADVPLDDSPESYEVDVYSSSAFTTLKRTITSSTQTATYTSAQQVTDFGVNQTTIYLKVYQLSATTGRGFAGTATITV